MQNHLKSFEEILQYLTRISIETRNAEVCLHAKEGTAKIYLADSLIIWAFASGQDKTFQSIVMQKNTVSKEQILLTIKKARNNGKKSLDEILLLLGIQNPQERMEIMFTQVVSALKQLGTWSHSTVEICENYAPPQKNIQAVSLRSAIEALNLTPKPDSCFNTELVFADEGKKPRRPPSLSLEDEHALKLDAPSLLERISSDIPDCIAALILDGASGAEICSICENPRLNLESVGNCSLNLNSAAVSFVRAIDSCGKQQDRPPQRELAFSTDTEQVILTRLNGGKHLLSLIIGQETNKNMAKVVINRYLGKLERCLKKGL